MSHLVIREQSFKALSIALLVILGVIATYFFELQLGLSVAGEIVLILMLLGFWYLTRIFRGDVETDLPRPRWRMTARPIMGYVLGVFFIVIGVTNFFIGYSLLNFMQIIAYLLMTVLGVLFFRSSIKLNKLEREDR